jgi:hypothetical protein
MGNPFCSNCNVATRIRWGKTDAGHNEKTGMQSYGRSKFYICPRCGRRWQVGAEVIQKKRDPAEIRAEIKAFKEELKRKKEAEAKGVEERRE